MGLIAYFSIGLLGCLVGGVHAGDPCPENWLSYNGHCYGYFSQEVTWQEGETRCQQSGGHLASILNASEHKAIARFMRQSQWGDADDADEEDVWFGLSVKGKSWTWADGSPVEYTAWEESKGYSDLDDEHCAQLEESSGFMQWDNESCFDKNPFLCKV